MSSRPEPEWDDVEVGWMLALQHWRESICPSCGWPKAICQDPTTEFRLNVPLPTRCHVTTAVDRAQESYSSLPGARLGGLLWRAEIRGDGSLPDVD